MSMEARLAELAATSYPYRWISMFFGIPYWVVLAYRDDTATGFEARELVFNKYPNDAPELRQFITLAERRRQ